MSSLDVLPVTPPHGDAEATPTARRLAVTWQHPETRSIQPVGLLSFDGSTYTFHYIINAADVAGFGTLLGFPDRTVTYRSGALFPLFAQRVMDPRRPDYARYVRRLGLEADATPWEQMSRSGGSREGDTLQLFPEPVIAPDGGVTCTFLVHGFRHVPSRPLTVDGTPTLVSAGQMERRLRDLHTGHALRAVPEPDNPRNPRAVLVATPEGFPLGWVPDLLVGDLHRLSSGDPAGIEMAVLHVNGPDALPHLRLLARLSATAVEGYRPFSGPTWQPFTQ